MLKFNGAKISVLLVSAAALSACGETTPSFTKIDGSLLIVTQGQIDGEGGEAPIPEASPSPGVSPIPSPSISPTPMPSVSPSPGGGGGGGGENGGSNGGTEGGGNGGSNGGGNGGGGEKPRGPKKPPEAPVGPVSCGEGFSTLGAEFKCHSSASSQPNQIQCVIKYGHRVSAARRGGIAKGTVAAQYDPADASASSCPVSEPDSVIAKLHALAGSNTGQFHFSGNFYLCLTPEMVAAGHQAVRSQVATQFLNQLSGENAAALISGFRKGNQIVPLPGDGAQAASARYCSRH